jgi:hypothetical protein
VKREARRPPEVFGDFDAVFDCCIISFFQAQRFDTTPPRKLTHHAPERHGVQHKRERVLFYLY